MVSSTHTLLRFAALSTLADSSNHFYVFMIELISRFTSHLLRAAPHKSRHFSLRLSDVFILLSLQRSFTHFWKQ
ncbi:hypothetical protein BOTBODRAFT_252177 [Botryobasidium botryosum FD-172 SS1]|uniref:Uncharacterized protein n=1 Tax=Botryobasidium botryosum (strain FD-172 SS1) TaxID=930990 RepID=A0A067MPB4_BOTB1|nr:hypothetical protein BOTBODRAFT_252177 [Botryobasidium botryosum FD-172 SS1]